MDGFSDWVPADGTANRDRGAREIWVFAGTARTWLAIRKRWAADWVRVLRTVRPISTRANNSLGGRRVTRAPRIPVGWAYFPRPNWSVRNSVTTICTWKTICHAVLICYRQACFSGTFTYTYKVPFCSCTDYYYYYYCNTKLSASRGVFFSQNSNN